MKLAVPIWDGRVSPVFDVCRRLMLAQIEQRRIVSCEEVPVRGNSPETCVGQLVDAKVEVLLCGAISGYLRCSLQQAAICVVPHLCGPVEQVIVAYLSNRLPEHGFVMPGCGCGQGLGRRRRHRGGRYGPEFSVIPRSSES